VRPCPWSFCFVRADRPYGVLQTIEPTAAQWSPCTHRARPSRTRRSTEGDATRARSAHAGNGRQSMPHHLGDERRVAVSSQVPTTSSSLLHIEHCEPQMRIQGERREAVLQLGMACTFIRVGYRAGSCPRLAQRGTTSGSKKIAHRPGEEGLTPYPWFDRRDGKNRRYGEQARRNKVKTRPPSHHMPNDNVNRARLSVA